MALTSAYLVAYEHERVRVTSEQQRRLLQFQARHGAAWFTAGHQTLRLSSYVGIIQLPGLTLEILPKADDPARTITGAGQWKHVLLQMLQRVYEMPVAVPAAAQLAQAPHAMLDLFVAAFVQAAESLLQRGLVKRYRVTDENRPALKGQLLFAQQLRHNLSHGEHFFTRAQVYDVAHPLNSLIRMALQVAAGQARGTSLAARARTLLLHWPEVAAVAVPAEMPRLTRKTEPYRTALELALLLLNHSSPTIQGGGTEAVALLFDMNRLFELYVAKQLRRAAGSRAKVKVQNQQSFWGSVRIRPDLAVTIQGQCFVLDTKWKLPKHQRPAAADLQQLYAYCHLWKSPHGLLLYPGITRQGKAQQQDFQASGLMPNQSVTAHVYFADVLDHKEGLNPAFGATLLGYLENLLKDSIHLSVREQKVG
ncbi:McrC family protein [Hymenobacter latericoloratus]|nr:MULTISPECIES: McrC family protein [Hymenobacter]